MQGTGAFNTIIKIYAVSPRGSLPPEQLPQANMFSISKPNSMVFSIWVAKRPIANTTTATTLAIFFIFKSF